MGAEIDLTPWLRDTEVKFVYPVTRLLIAIELNREPMPPMGVNRLLSFVPEVG